MAAYTPTGYGTIKRETLEAVAGNRRKVDLTNCSGPRWVRLRSTATFYLEVPGGNDASALGSDYETYGANETVVRRITPAQTAFCLTGTVNSQVVEITIMSELG